MVDALLLNHPGDAQYVQSVNDTLHRALPSLQSVSTTDIGITMHFRCNCDEGVRIFRTAREMHPQVVKCCTDTLRDLTADDDLLLRSNAESVGLIDLKP